MAPEKLNRSGRMEYLDIDPYWLQFPPAPSPIHFAIANLVIAITVVSLITNGGVIYVYAKNKKLNPNLRPYVIVLAVSDIVSPALTNWMFVVSSFNTEWLFGNLGCTIYGMTQGLGSLVSIATIAVISTERCASIWWPNTMKSLHHHSFYYAIVLSLLHIYCFLAASPPLFGWSRYALDGLLTSCCFEFIRRDLETSLFMIYLFVLGFVIPCTLILFSFFVIRSYLLRSPFISRLNNCRRQRREKRRFRMITVLTSAFLFAWTPYAVLTLMGQFGPRTWTVGPYMMTMVSLLTKTSTVYNPIIYAYTDANFRRLIVAAGHRDSANVPVIRKFSCSPLNGDHRFLQPQSPLMAPNASPNFQSRSFSHSYQFTAEN